MKKAIMVLAMVAGLAASVFGKEWRISDELIYNDETEKFTYVKAFKNMNIEDFKWCKKDIETEDRKFSKKAPNIDSSFRISTLPRTLDGLNKRYNYVEFQGNKYIKQNDQWYSDKSIYRNLISLDEYYTAFEVYNPKAPDFGFMKSVYDQYLCDENPDAINTFYPDEKTYQEAKKDIETRAKGDSKINGIYYDCKDKQITVVLVDNTIVIRTWYK